MRPECPRWEESETDDQLPSVVDGICGFVSFTLKKAKIYSLQHGDIKTWHGRIFRDVVPLAYYAGHYRSDDPMRPCLRKNVSVNGFFGAPFADVPNRMREFSKEMRDLSIITDRYIKRDPTPMYRAQAVTQFAAIYVGKLLQIHPFINGNGRMSRLTANFFLHRYGYPMGFPNPHLRPNSNYIDASAACMVGDYKPMYKYLLTQLGTRLPS